MSSQAGGEAGCNIQVVVRIRPMNDQENKAGTLPVVSASTERREVSVIRGAGPRQVRSTYNFDNVFTSYSTQEEVFRATLAPVVEDVLNGYESTVFAYGQTGTGKTYTMEGVLTSEPDRGVIPRAAEAIFERLQRGSKYTDFDITASYLEIYNEELCDLLAPSNEPSSSTSSSASSGANKLQVVEDKKRGVFCLGLSEQAVSSPQDVLALMQQAQERRRVGETKMNKLSSRSHCLFTLKVHSRATLEDGSIMESTGKLHMVDLAGSECAKTAGQDPSRERERKNINQSLLTLGRVITALREGGGNSQQRIPYRDSKLTRLLQESLGGRCKTVLIATLSPSILAVEETLSTLTYAQAAGSISNKPIATSYLRMTRNPLLAAVGGADGAGAGGAAGAAGAGGGATIQDWKELECRMAYMEAQLEEAQSALARKHREQQEHIDRADRAEAERDQLAADLHAAKIEITAAARKQEQTEEQLRQAHKVIAQRNAILDRYRQTETALQSEATTLLASLRESISAGDSLFAHIEATAAKDVEHREAAVILSNGCDSAAQAIHAQVEQLQAVVVATREQVVKAVQSIQNRVEECAKTVSSNTTEARDATIAGVNTMTSTLQEARDLATNSLNQMQTQVETESQAAVKSGDQSAASIAETMKAAIADIHSGEQQLVVWSEKTVQQLQQAAEDLQQATSAHSTLLKQASSWNTSQVEELTKALVLHRADTNRLAADLQGHKTKLEELNNVRAQLAATNQKQTERQMEALATQKKALVNVQKVQKAGQKDHDVHSVLAQTNAYLADTTSKHAAKIGEQQAILNSEHQALQVHQQCLDDLRKQHQVQLEGMMATVMQTVQQMLKVESAKIASTIETGITTCLEQTTSNASRVQELAQSNGVLLAQIETAKVDLHKTIHSADTTVSEWAASDVHVREELSRIETAGIESVEKIVDETNKMVDDFVQEIDSRVEELSSLTADSVSFTSNTLGACIDKIQGEQVVAFGRGNQERLSELSKHTEEEMSRIANAHFTAEKKAIDEMLAPRSAHASRLETACVSTTAVAAEAAKTTQQTAHSAATRAKEVVATQKEVWERLVDATEEMSKVLETSATEAAAASEAEVQKNVVDVVEQIGTARVAGESQISATSSFVQENREATVSLVSTVDQYLRDVIGMHSAPEPLPSRKVIVYSDYISSTPSEEEILSGRRSVDDVSVAAAPLRVSSPVVSSSASVVPAVEDAEISTISSSMVGDENADPSEHHHQQQQQQNSSLSSISHGVKRPASGGVVGVKRGTGAELVGLSHKVAKSSTSSSVVASNGGGGVKESSRIPSARAKTPLQNAN